MPANPLTLTPPKDDPMMRHAKIWQHVGKMAPDAIPAHVERMEYVLPILGALASDPNVKAKDVIKAAAQAAADGKVDAGQAVGFISGMPADPDKIRPWLKGLYAANLSAHVHMKAAMLQQRQQAPQAVPVAAPQGGAP